MKQRSDLIMDLITLAELARTEQAIQRQEEVIIIHAATLSARRIRTVMVPADQVKIFDCRKTLLENTRDVGPTFHRSYPVSRDGTLDNLEGTIHLQELLLNHLHADREADTGWRPQLRPLLEVDGAASVSSLLTDFLQHREIAALVKKDGVNIGWITFNDVAGLLMGARS